MIGGFMHKLITGVCLGFLLLTSSLGFSAPPAKESAAITKIIYGSCIHQEHPQPIWQAINQVQPELFVFLGDNVYGDTEDMNLLTAKYQTLGNNAGFKQLKTNTPIVATWDDHDYGANDAGKDFPYKEQSRKIMLDFFEEPETSERRSRNSGIYTSYYFGEGERRVQLILTDLRWNRTEPKALGWFEYLMSLIDSRGPYLATTTENSGSKASILGDAQWQWLEAELQQPAAIRIIASSLQVIPESSGWEAWAVFPDERKKLFKLLKNSQQKALFLISGDTHWSEFSRLEQNGFALLELTSSGLTEEWSLVSPNEHRVGNYYNKANFGLIEIDWEEGKVKLSIRDEKGDEQLSQSLLFNSKKL